MKGPPRPCTYCTVYRDVLGRNCALRKAVLAETGRDIRCAGCGDTPHNVPLSSDGGDWYCLDCLPREDYTAKELGL